MAVVALRLLGRDEESVAGARRLVAMLKAAYPDGHPQTGWALTELATSLDNAGRLSACREAFAEAEELFGRLVGESHPDVMTYATLGMAFAAVQAGDAPGLRSRVERSRQTKGLRPVVRAWWDAMAALADGYEGDLDGARAILAALLAEHAGEAKVEPVVRMYAAEVERRAGNIEAARALAEPALAIFRAGVPPSHGRRGEPRHAAGEMPAFVGALRVEGGAAAEGIALLEEALQAAASIPEPDVVWYAPLANYWLAVALADTGGDMSRAIRLARTARSQAAVVDPGGIGIAELATTFLREHGEAVP